ncbi:BTB/POZ and MATH domain-containing protein 2 [Brachypodium distachyon]|uniref:BTB/POZ and MATH domain-containing protein 2 n=1 Tax=Brachypodium distachyon TaxID=15368 RepID=UPI000234FD86|nr:BTB/POZ and MATH domain-containing protein 2 [Brachypodium distachyon]|eukprot:XP_024316400.1 BTB/POZ and MATH domain-containing protein 2 [Brachypodium distachyon]
MAFAGVSVCPYTESTFDAGAINSGYHLLVVQGYTRVTEDSIPRCGYIHSRPFMVGGHLWSLESYPFGCCQDEFMSVYLCCLEDDTDDTAPVRAQFSLSFIDQPELRTSFTCGRKIHDFYPGTTNNLYGEERFMRKNVFERSRHLKDDGFVIRCDILVIENNTNKTDTAEEEQVPMVTDTEKQADGSGTHDTDADAEEQPPVDMRSHFSDLLRTKESSDVTFEVGGEKFAAHRCVLAARSTVFKEKLFGNVVLEAKGGAVLKIDDIKPNVFSALLTFIYTDAFCGMEVDNEPKPVTWLLQLLKAADTYDLQKLRLICEEMLAGRYMQVTNVAVIVAVAERRRCHWLKEMCLEFIKSHTRLLKIFTDDGLEEMIRTCSPSVLKELVAKFAVPN